MKIKCQEHYDKVVEYVKSIGDTTFEKCIERLKQWEKNSNGRYEIELYWDFAPYSFGFAEVRWLRTEAGVLSVDCYTMANRMNLLP